MMYVSDLHTGDLLYWKGKGFLPWLVRTWTRSPYAHVAVYLANGAGGAYYDAQPGKGVEALPFGDDPPQFAQVTHCGWSGLVHDQVNALVGRPYSYWTGIATTLGIAGRGTSAFICSELAMQILSYCGWDFKGKHYTPAGLAAAVTRANGNAVEGLSL